MTNQELITRFYSEVFAQGKIELVDDLLAPDFIWRRHALPLEPALGREGIKQFVTALHKAFPDLRFQAETPLCDGDKTVVRWNLRAHHGGPWLNFSATHHPIYVTGIHIARMENGHLCELWQNWGLMSLMQQLGLLPIIGEQTVYPEWQYPEPGSIREPLPLYQEHIARLEKENL
jgi:predicted ester cyclase